jgi:hypothetical protein
MWSMNGGTRGATATATTTTTTTTAMHNANGSHVSAATAAAAAAGPREYPVLAPCRLVLNHPSGLSRNGGGRAGGTTATHSKAPSPPAGLPAATVEHCRSLTTQAMTKKNPLPTYSFELGE